MQYRISSVIWFSALLFFIALIFLSFNSWAYAAGIVPCGGTNQSPCQPCHFIVLLIRLSNFLIRDFAVPASIIMFTYAGFRFAFSAGSDKSLTAAKTVLWNTIIGLLIVFGAFFMVDTSIKVLTGDIRARGFARSFGPWNAPVLPDKYGDCSSQIQPVEKAPAGSSATESASRISSVIATAARVFSIILMALSVIFILYAAFRYITSGGNEENITSARKTLIWALVGTAVALLAYYAPLFVGGLLSLKTVAPAPVILSSTEGIQSGLILPRGT